MIIATILTVTFLSGMLAGVLVLMRLAISREQRDSRFPCKAPTQLASAARMVAGLHVSMPERTVHTDGARTRIDTR